MYAWQFAKMLYTADEMGLTRFVSMQNHYNLIYREEERADAAAMPGRSIAVIPWSPLARGFVTGTAGARITGITVRRQDRHVWARSVLPACDFDVVDRITEVARNGAPPTRSGAAWMLQQPGVTAPISGPAHAAL